MIYLLIVFGIFWLLCLWCVSTLENEAKSVKTNVAKPWKISNSITYVTYESNGIFFMKKRDSFELLEILYKDGTTLKCENIKISKLHEILFGTTNISILNSINSILVNGNIIVVNKDLKLFLDTF